jgi:hypothetical protein
MRWWMMVRGVVAVLVFRRATCCVGLRQAKVVPTSTAWV